MVNAEGTWVKLDVDSVQSYCHEVQGEAWTLARGSDGIVYLQHESDARAVNGEVATSPFCLSASITDKSTGGFDFTASQNTPPSFLGFDPTQGYNYYILIHCISLFQFRPSRDSIPHKVILHVFPSHCSAVLWSFLTVSHLLMNSCVHLFLVNY